MADAGPSFRLLGEIIVDGVESAPLGGPKQRALLAFLLLHAGEVFTSDQLIDAFWGEDSPPSARATVHGYVRRLRVALGPTGAVLRTGPSGYTLDITRADLDQVAVPALPPGTYAFACHVHPNMTGKITAQP